MRGFFYFAKILSLISLAHLTSICVPSPGQAGDVFFQKNGWRGFVLISNRTFQACVAHANLSEQISFGLAQFPNKRDGPHESDS
jgi:hypothetical protein